MTWDAWLLVGLTVAMLVVIVGLWIAGTYWKRRALRALDEYERLTKAASAPKGEQ